MSVTIIRCNKLLSLTAFADLHGLNMTIRERDTADPEAANRFFASFDNTETKGGFFLKGSYGNGATPEDAMEDYAKEINGKMLVVDAYAKNRREIWAHLDIGD